MSTAARLSPSDNDVLRELQAPVRALLDAVQHELWRVVAAEIPLIANVNQHLMGMKGKLFRPTLVLLSSAVEGPTLPRGTALAAVVELIHLATLVHDDAVDHSVLRRGMPTINSLFSHQVSVIMGDYLYSRALAELVAGGDFEALGVLTRATTAMTVGEMRQLTALDALAFSERDYDDLIRAKTASLFSAACEVGAISGSPRHRAALARYGERLGMAFQVTDDLLDYTEAQEVTGKPTGLDLRDHKVTLPLIAALREMDAPTRVRVETLFATAEPADDQIADVIAIVDDHGGIEYARRRGQEFGREAEEALADMPSSPVTAALREAVGYVLDRRA